MDQGGGRGETNLGIYHINDHFGHTDLPTHKKQGRLSPRRWFREIKMDPGLAVAGEIDLFVFVGDKIEKKLSN